MATLSILHGSSPPGFVPLSEELVTLGRHPSCTIVIDSAAVSRQHAQIIWSEGQYFLEDLRSRNGTQLNGATIHGRVRLNDGDRITICETVMQFVAHRDDGFDFLSLVGLLQGQHVNYKGPHQPRLEAALRDPASELRVALAKSFHRVVLLDADAGRDAQGVFDIERFLEAAWIQLATEFGHYFDREVFHPEQIAQLLKSEPASLFCLLHVELLSEDDLHRLRGLGFTQNQHRVLYLGSNDSLGTMSYPLFSESEGAPGTALAPNLPSYLEAAVAISTASSLMMPAVREELVRPEVKLRAILEISRNLAGAVSMEDVLATTLQSLFTILPQSEQGVFLLRNAETAKLEVRAVRDRDGGDVSAPRISRTLLSRAIESGSPLLTADAVSDGSSPSADSISDLRIRSLMCAPLLGRSGEAIGVMHLTSQDSRQFSQSDLDLLVSIGSQVATTIENVTLQHEVQRQRDLNRELEFAAQVQQGFLPANPPQIAGYQFADYYEAARDVGGDIFDYVPMPDGRLAIVVGDVAGKGVPAALLMARMHAQQRYELLSNPTPADAMNRINAAMVESGMGTRFVTMVIVVLDPGAHAVTIVNAGALAPLLRSANGDVRRLGEQEAGLPLGITPDIVFQEIRVPIAPGESLVIHTDGVSEALNGEGAIYGNERLMECIRRSPPGASAIATAIIEDVASFSAGVVNRDDVCLVCLHREG
jgi:serine phosphatase RsbU (regulator of sigma subunit)